MPAHLRPPIKTSLGQRRSQTTPVAFRIASVAASPSAKRHQGSVSGTNGKRSTTETYRPASGFGMPRAAIAAVARGLLFGDHRGSGGSPACGQAARREHSGVDAVEPIDPPCRELAAHPANVERHLCELQAQVDVHGPGRVGDRAAGDEVGPGLGVGADGFERDAARTARHRRGRRCARSTPASAPAV